MLAKANYGRRYFMTEREILRNQKWRLGIIQHAEEATGNVAKTCRYFGINRSIYYRWYERYRKYGVEGLKIGLGVQ